MRVEVFTAVSAFQDLRAEWRQLLVQLPFQSVFFYPRVAGNVVATFWRDPSIAHADSTLQRWDAARVGPLDE